MVHTAQQFAQELDIAVQIEAADWPRNLVMDGKKLEKAGIRFDTTQQGIRHCLRDYGLASRYKEKNDERRDSAGALPAFQRQRI